MTNNNTTTRREKSERY